MKKGQALVVLLDEGTPIGAATPFSDRGHSVILFGQVLLPAASDKQVCAMAIHHGALLVATDRDMKQIAKRFGNPEQGGKYKHLNLLSLTCNSVLAPKRIAHFIQLIELEWQIACEKKARTLWLDIGGHYFRTYR